MRTARQGPVALPCPGPVGRLPLIAGRPLQEVFGAGLHVVLPHLPGLEEFIKKLESRTSRSVLLDVNTAIGMGILRTYIYMYELRIRSMLCLKARITFLVAPLTGNQVPRTVQSYH